MKKHLLKPLSAGVLLALMSPALLAANAITNIELLSNSQDEQVLALSFAEPPETPASFSITNPPRIAFDFKDTKNQSGQSQLQFNGSLLNAATIVESADRSRLVLNLNKSTGHATTINANKLLIALGGSGNAGTARYKTTSTADAANLQATSSYAANTAGMIRNVEFRRGNGGEARIIVDLPASNTPVELKREGNSVMVDIAGARLPRHLERRLDVSDFATPSSRVDAVNQGTGSRIAIQSNGNWEYSSYQTEKQLVVEIRQITQEESDANLRAQGKNNYKGQRLSLNFQTVEVRSLLQVIAEFTGLNIITSDSVNGTLTLRLNDVPWDQALDLILEQKNLEKRQVGNVLRIAPREEMLNIERQAAEARKQKTSAEPVVTETFAIKYRGVEEVKDALKEIVKSNALNNGSSNNNDTTSEALVVDPRSNRIIVRAKVSTIEEIRHIIQIVDIPLRQVLIEARIVEARDNFQRDLGVRLGITKTGGDTSIGTLDSTGSTISSGNNINLPASLTGATIGAIFKNASTLISLELSAMQAEDRGKVVSSPRILTADRTKATITEGTEIPYQSTDDNGKATTTFKKANLSLSVTPQVTPEDDIIMDLYVTKDTANTKLSLSAGLAIDNKTVQTQVRVENGGTIVIGGIYTEEESSVENKVPLLAEIPVLGALFRNKSNTKNRSELLIFITPRIVENDLITR